MNETENKNEFNGEAAGSVTYPDEIREEAPVTVTAPEVPAEQELPEAESSAAQAVLPAASPDPAPAGEAAYHWNFSVQAAADQAEKKKEGRKGALVYAAIVTGLFLICFSILAGVLIYGSVHGFSPAEKTVYKDRIVYVREDASYSGMLSAQEIAAKVIPSTVGVKVVTSTGSGTGTGIVLDKDGYIVTNYHVIEKQVSITVIMADSTEFSAKLIGGDASSDIAVIQIESGDYELIPAEFGNSDSLLVGDSVIAIGNAGGMDLFGTVTKGVISGVNRDIKFYDENDLVQKRMTLIQTDANINPGNSGGPLVDMYGKVIGINFMKYVADEFEGIGFAIPADGALEIITEIKETGQYTGHAVAEKGVSLGIQGGTVKKGQYISELQTNAAADGVIVTVISGEDSSAYGALYPGDIIVAINGKTVTTIEEIRTILSNCRVGDVLTMTVVRDHLRQDVAVTLK